MASDQHTIQRCLDGHPHDFRLLVDRYAPSLRIHLIRDLNGHAPAEPHSDLVDDSVQEALVRAYFLLPRLREPESFWSWLLGIGRRVLKEQQRAQRRASAAPHLLLNGTSRSFSSINGTARATHAAHSSAEPARHDAEAAGLEAAVVALPEPYREVILLRFYAGLSCPVIAEQLNLPIGTVTKRLSRAYELLRDSLADPATPAPSAASNTARSPKDQSPVGGAS